MNEEIPLPTLNSRTYVKSMMQLCFAPLLFIGIVFIAHLFFKNGAILLSQYIDITPEVITLEKSIYLLSLFLSCYWLFNRLINKGTQFLANTNLFLGHAIIRIILPLFSAVLKILAFLTLFNMMIQYLNLPKEMSFLLTKLTSILIICSISWILFKLVDISQQLLVHHHTPKQEENINSRKIYTQSIILKRIAYSIISILTLGAILMLFENVRTLGASVLTTAGIFGLVITFTAQRSLGSLFSSLEIALTQPIKIGDAVVIGDERGTIEEINFRNVIVKLWDWRRLVVPTNYFLENSFQNWSREQTTNLIGSVFLYVDFTLPVSALRDELNNILTHSSFWDGTIGNLTVSDLQAQVMQLKILASAKNAGDVGNLCNEIREKLINYIVKNYPECLPRVRHITTTPELRPNVTA